MGFFDKLKAKVAQVFAKLKSFVKKAEDRVVGHENDHSDRNPPPPPV